MSHREKTNPPPSHMSKINDGTKKARQGIVEYATEALCFLHSWRISNVLLIQLCRGRLPLSGLSVVLDCAYIFRSERWVFADHSSPLQYCFRTQLADRVLCTITGQLRKKSPDKESCVTEFWEITNNHDVADASFSRTLSFRNYGGVSTLRSRFLPRMLFRFELFDHWYL